MDSKTQGEILQKLREVDTIGNLVEILQKYFDENEKIPQWKKYQIGVFGNTLISGLPEKK